MFKKNIWLFLSIWFLKINLILVDIVYIIFMTLACSFLFFKGISFSLIHVDFLSLASFQICPTIF